MVNDDIKRLKICPVQLLDKNLGNYQKNNENILNFTIVKKNNIHPLLSENPKQTKPIFVKTFLLIQRMTYMQVA